ncbi:MAG: hypothetical protein ACSHWQ_07030 [Spongiibacteraceae bacterium]
MNSKIISIAAISLSLVAGSALARPPHLEKMDSNKDGNITRVEAEQAAANRAQRIDLNADGIISVGELRAERERRKLEHLQRRLTKADSNADGSVQLDEFSAQIVESIMRLDRNEDDKLSGNEMVPRHGPGDRGPRQDKGK